MNQTEVDAKQEGEDAAADGGYFDFLSAFEIFLTVPGGFREFFRGQCRVLVDGGSPAVLAETDSGRIGFMANWAYNP